MSEKTRDNGLTEQAVSAARRVARLVLVLVVTLTVLAGVVTFLLTMGISVPDRVLGRLENRLNAALPGGHVSIRDAQLILSQSQPIPVAVLSGIEFRDPQGRVMAVLPELRAELEPVELLLGRLRPAHISVIGGEADVRRDRDGRINIALGTSGDALFTRSLADALSGAEKLFGISFLEDLQTITTLESRVTYHDGLTGRIWRFRDGAFVFQNDADEVSAEVTFRLENKTAAAAEATFTLRKMRGEARSQFLTRFSGLRSGDLSDQVVAFSWLKILDAPISGSVSLEIDAKGGFGAMSGVLDIGEGRISGGAGNGRLTKFSGAKTYLSFDPEQKKLTFDQITLKIGESELIAEGHAYLDDLIGRSVNSITAQLRFSKILLSRQDLFAEPVAFSLGAADLRVNLAPLKVEIGQLVLVDEVASYRLRGEISAHPEGWASALDLRVRSLPRDRLLALWPLALAAKTRIWLEKNALGGRLENITGALRAKPGEKPRATIGFDAAGLRFRFMNTMPIVEGGIGYGLLDGNTLTMVLEQGLVTAPDGGEINVAGTTLTIPDIRIKPAPSRIAVKTRSSIPSLLAILDLKPFEFLKKGGLRTDIAEGVVTTDGLILMPLKEKVPLEEIEFSFRGGIENASSDKLIAGKVLTAARLRGFADESGLTISGDARLGKVPVSGSWRQGFGPEHKGKSRVEARIELSQRFLDEFAIALPKGSVRKRGVGNLTVDLRTGKAPRFKLVSDLNRLRLTLEPLGWSKPENATGKLSVSGTLGPPAQIDDIRVKIKGLEASGSISLKPDGSLKLARFDKVDVGGWMTAPIDIRTGPDGNPAFTLNGGVIDFRRSRFSSGGASEGGGNRITMRLDRVVLRAGQRQGQNRRRGCASVGGNRGAVHLSRCGGGHARGRCFCVGTGWADGHGFAANQDTRTLRRHDEGHQDAGQG
ncbi:MAG: hypothetical protein ACE5DK_04345, partial [Paracoccaceae bacterium]